MMEKGRVFGNLENIIIMITVIGTQRTIPIIPQIEPQKARDIIITKGLIFNESPINLGSKIFPIAI